LTRKAVDGQVYIFDFVPVVDDINGIIHRFSRGNGNVGIGSVQFHAVICRCRMSMEGDQKNEKKENKAGTSRINRHVKILLNF
jgi:hypothetical protein